MQTKGPVVEPLPCSGCGRLIDPIRAGHVAIFDQRFHFFCDFDHCRPLFLGLPLEAPSASTEPGAVEPIARPSVDEIRSAFKPAPEPVLPVAPPPEDYTSLVEPIGQTILSDVPPHLDVPEPKDVGPLLLVMATVSGALAVSLTLAGDARLVLVARVILAAVGAGMLFGRAATTVRDAADPPHAPVLTSCVLALCVAAWAAVRKDRALGSEAASLAGIVVTACAVSAWLAESARRRVRAEAAWIATTLASPGRRVSADGNFGDVTKELVFDLRPGEQTLVEPGEVVPVDLVVTGGEVEILPWIGASSPTRRRNGDPVVAGASVVRGKLRGVCTWAGNDRAFARLLIDPRRRADTLAQISRASRLIVDRWAVVAGLVTAVFATLARRDAREVAMMALAVHTSLSTPMIASIASVHVVRGVLLGARRGIVYRSADAWDRAGRIAVVVFCARGTLLLGEPDLAELESVSPELAPRDVLALAAGAERAEEHPIAAAILRAARARGVRPDGVRNTTFHPGQGVTAITSWGEELCVGNRALLFEQRISVAAAESRLAELENLGRTVVLVAVGSRLVGLCALQDGLRAGARAGVQHLLDAQIEPVMLAGDSRATCEAIGRSLDIDHVRPEIVPLDRGGEVRRLIDNGLSVAAIGHPNVDDAALGAADTAVALRAAGATPGEYAISLASDDVRDAALSIALAHRTRLDARLGLSLALAPAIVGAIVVALGILPPAYAPVASLLGAAMALAHVRRCP